MTPINQNNNNWVVCQLKDAGRIVSGGTPSTKEPAFWGNEVAWITPADLSGYRNKYISVGRKSISENGLKNSSAKIIPKGSVLFSSRAPIGYVVIADNELATNQGFKNIVPSAEVNSVFLYYYLISIKELAIENASGTTFKEISGSKFSELPFFLPPRDEQERIVAKIEELFSELDAGVQSLKHAQAQLKTYRQSVLKWAFEGKLTNENWNEGELPEGWKRKTVGDVAINVEYGSAAKSKKTGKVPVLRMGNIQNGRFDWSDLVFTSDKREIEKYLLNRNDVLFNRTNSPEWVGKTALFNGERTAIFAGYLIRINRIESAIDAKYLTYFLNSRDARKYGNSVKTFGVNQANINGTKLKSYPLPVCSLEEQHRVVDEIESRLSVCDKLEESIETSLKQSEALRQSILKQAFEGRLVDASIASN